MFKRGVLKHTLGGLLACLNVEFPSIHQKVFLLVKCGVLKHTLELVKCGVLQHTLEGLVACLNVEFSSIHWKVFLLV